MKCKIAWREMGKSKGFFIMCCAVAFVGSTLAYYGMRVLLSAYALTPSAGNAYDYKNFFLMEGWFIFAMSFLLCCEILLLSFLSLPDGYMRNVGVLKKLGTDTDYFTVLLSVQLIALVAPALTAGIAVGEILLKFCPDLLTGRSLPLAKAFPAVWRVVLLYILAVLLIAVLSAVRCSKGKQPDVRRLPLVRLSKKTKGLSVRLGAVAFLRRKRPIFSQLLLCFAMVFFILFEGCTVYFDFLDRNFYRSIYDYSVTVDGTDGTTFAEVTDIVKKADEYVLWRQYRTTVSVGASDIVTRADAQIIVLSDKDFKQLALYAGADADSAQALLQNYVYGKETFDKVPVVENSSTNEYFLNSDFKFKISAYLSDVPQKFVSGQEDLFVYKLFFKQSEFNFMGDADIYTARFSCNDLQFLRQLTDELQGLKGVVLTDIAEKYRSTEDIAVLNAVLPALLVAFVPLLALSVLLFFLRDVKSLREECRILRSLGISNFALTVKTMTEYLLTATLILIITSAPSLALLRFAHFSALGNAVRFFVPWQGFVFSALFVYGIAVIVSLMSASGRKVR